MNILRNYWPDFGILLALATTLYIQSNAATWTPLQLLLWISLVSLFFHQFEEYRVPGKFPFMLNRVMFKSDSPDRYPLNSNTAFIINVCIGWLVYFLAAVFAEHAAWLAIAAMLVSVGNVIAHVGLFNIKGRTFYNAGMLTAIFLFIPISTIFFYLLLTQHLATPLDYIVGIMLGIILNYVGVFKVIHWLRNKNTPYVFRAPFRSVKSWSSCSDDD